VQLLLFEIISKYYILLKKIKIMLKKPLIGLTLDLETKKTYSKFPWYAIRKNYCSTIVKYGGIPIPLVYDNKNIKEIIDIIDGLVITGGAFDINPNFFSEKRKYGNVITKEKRTEFEFSICDKFLSINKPVLGICGGQQLLNVVYGGTLVQDIENEIKTKIKHEQENPRNQTSHSVNILKNTKLLGIVKKEKIKVNSAHHQAVRKIGYGLCLNAIAPDDVIEGIEDKTKKFCIGVQWHPEFLIEQSDKNIFESFIRESIK
tara:strand:- start:257 stop:1036 length:780 start_codon:yes stop_codon:yes gene_type:complete